MYTTHTPLYKNAFFVESFTDVYQHSLNEPFVQRVTLLNVKDSKSIAHNAASHPSSVTVFFLIVM